MVNDQRLTVTGYIQHGSFDWRFVYLGLAEKVFHEFWES